MPEAFLNVTRGTETIIRDLAPFNNSIQGGPHGRYTKACDTCKPPVMWLTEINLSPTSGESKPNASGTYTYTPRTDAEADHIGAKDFLRYIVSWVNKGVKAIDFYAASAGTLSLINQSFFTDLTANDIKHNPAYYPGDNTGGVSVNAIHNLTDIMKSGASPITQPRQLALTKIADNHNHFQFDKTDDTPGHPPLYDRDILAVLPFQISNSKFAIPAYVMTRDVTQIYNPNAADDGSKYDMPPEAFQLTMGGFNPAKTYSASAIDPLDNSSTPVSIVSQGGGTMVIQADLTDSPRVIVLTESGNSSGSSTPDTTPPDTLITIGPSGTRQKTDISYSFTSTESGSTFECQLDGGTFKPCTSPHVFNDLPIGTHTFAFHATDAAGNTDPTPATGTWTVQAPVTAGDTTPPDTTISPISASTLGGTTATFTFTSSEPGGGSFGCKLDSANYAACTNPKTYTGLAAGFHNFTVRATDAAGNTDTSGATYNWLVSGAADVVDPIVNITSPANGATLSGIATVDASASDNIAVGRVEFALDGVTKVSDITAPYNYSFDTKTLANGTHTVTVTAFDQAGNTAADTLNFSVSNVDTTKPSAPTSLAATAPNPTTVNLTWHASTDSGTNPSGVVKYNVLRNGVVIAQPTTTSFTDLNRASNTSYSYVVQAVDGAGNVSANSNTATIKTPTAPDTTDPTVPNHLTATAVSINQINLSWDASTDSGGSGIAGYNVYQGSTKLNSGLITGTSYGDSTADADTSYTYTVEAVDGAGNVSAKSSAATTRTPEIIRGDVTGVVAAPDGKIDIRDISYMIRKYDTTDKTGDISGPGGTPDGVVNIYDLSYVIRNYGQ